MALKQKDRALCIAFIFSIIFLSVNTCFSQDFEIKYDELRVKWQDESYDSLVSFYQQANRVFDTIRMDMAAQLILEKAKQEDKAEYYIRGHQFFSITNRKKGKYLESITHIDKAISFLEKVKYNRKTNIYLSKGNLHQKIGEYDIALDSYLKCLVFIEEEEKPLSIKISVHNNIATLKSLLLDANGALEEYSKVLKMIDKDESHEKEHIVSTLIGISKSYTDLGDYENGLSYCYELMEKSELYDDKIGKIQGLMGLGRILTLMGSYDKALIHLKEAQSIENAVDRDYLHTGIHVFKARAYYFLKDYKTVISELKSAENLIYKNEFGQFYLEEMNILFARSYKELNEIDNARYYLTKSFDVIEENNLRKSRLNNDILNKYDLGALHSELKEAEEKFKNQKSLLRIFLIALLGLVLISFMTYAYISRENKKKFDALISSLNREEAINKVNVQSVEIEDEKVAEILKKLNTFEREEQYLQRDTSLTTVAKKMNTNTTYLSKVINAHKKKTFISYVTDLRIDHAVKKLKNEPRLRAYTIASIANEMGFNSVNTFARAFKKKVGITPAYFIKQVEKSLNL